MKLKKYSVISQKVRDKSNIPQLKFVTCNELMEECIVITPFTE